MTQVAGSPARSGLTALARGTTAFVVAWLLALAAVAWLWTVRNAGSMSDMLSGLGHVGSRMPNDMGAPLFLGMWVGMMAAMMLPTVAPIVLTHLAVNRRRGNGSGSTVVFVFGYLLVWSAIGIIPAAAFLAFRDLSGGGDWVRYAAGGVLLAAGIYQFTGWKAKCLGACRDPFSFVLTHDFKGGARSAFRAGLSHGAFCLGCCWALMAVLVVVGFMNLVWMAGLSLVFLAEKNWRHGVGLSKLAGTAVAVLGLVVLARPDVLAPVAGA